MAKEVVAHIKLQIPAGQANPAPPVGTALGPRGVNIMAFCKEFNAATQKQAGDILPVVITVFKDKSFTFITKSPPAAVLLKKAANIAAGSKEPNKTKVGKVTRKQVMDIVKTKSKDLNARDDEAAYRIMLVPPARWASKSSIKTERRITRIARIRERTRLACWFRRPRRTELCRRGISTCKMHIGRDSLEGYLPMSPKYSHRCNAIGTLPFFQTKSWKALRLNFSPCCIRASARNFTI